MTLHDTTETLKKAGIGSLIGIAGIVGIVILFWIGVAIKNIYLPPKLDPPIMTYGPLPPIDFPDNTVNTSFTYDIKTVTGELPTGLPDRLTVFPIINKPPNFLNLEKIKTKVGALDFKTSDGAVVPEIQLTNPYYEWNEPKDYRRKIIFNINSYDFKMTSDYLQSLNALTGRFISNETNAINTAKKFLEDAILLPLDLDDTKTNTPNNPITYVTYPTLYSIQTNEVGINTLVPATSRADAHVIRVDLYQKDIEYELIVSKTETKKNAKIKIPVIYPNPPFSTMSFWIASGPNKAIVTQAFYTHKDIDIKDTTATYPLKTVQTAFKELQEGKAYIAAYNGTDSNISIRNIFLAYYLAEDPQQYLMPVYVFEGNNNFFAYVSAITESQAAEKK